MSFLSKLKEKIVNNLIPDWKQAYKMFSVQISTIFSTALTVWLVLPEDQKAAILGIVGVNGASALALAGFVLVVIGRLKSQPSLDKPAE